MNADLPYLPFSRPTLDEATIADVAAVLRSGWITSGPKVRLFEEALSRMFGNRPVRVVASATAALEIALALAGVGSGDEVITPSLTFFAAPNTIVRSGATPVFVDVVPTTRNLDLAAAERAIGPRTRALLPVHFAGLPCPPDALHGLARRHGLRVIEDAALAFGATWQGATVGSAGDLTVLSFHPNKNITTIEGGALVLNDDDEAREVERLRFHGIVRLPDGTRDVAVAGGKFNLPDVNAAVGLRQMAGLPGFLERRRRLARRYLARLRTDPPLELPHPGHAGDEDGHAWNLFAPLLPLPQMTLSRQAFRAALEARGIGTGVSYEAAHLATAYRGRARAGELPHTERICATTVTLPLFPAMTEADVDRVCDACADVLAPSTASLPASAPS